MAGSPSEIAYEQAMRGLDGQAQDLASIRGNMNIIITAGGLAAAFLGAKSPDHGRWFWAAAGTFAAIGLTTIVAYWPVGWVYSFDADEVVTSYVDANPAWTTDETLRELAIHGAESYAGNRQVLDRLFNFQSFALVLFGAEVIALLINIAR